MKIFGLKELSGKVPELLIKQTKHKNEPEKWDWIPAKPEKIKNLEDELKREWEEVDCAVMTNYTMSQERQKVILVFFVGNLNYGLIQTLEKENIKYFYVNYAQFIAKEGSVKIAIDNDIEKKIISLEDIYLDLNDVKVIIWNPSSFASPIADSAIIPKKKGRNEYLFKKRWTQLLRDLIHLVPKDTVWLPGNPFNGSQDWQNKIGEYSLAKSLGFKIPPMVFTNCLEEFNQFVLKHGNDLFLREFSIPPYSFPPVRVDANKLNFDFFSKSPNCFQKYIEKKHEFRVVVIFNSIYACKIDSQNSTLANEDWRVHDDAKVKWSLSELPVDLKNKIILFKDRLNLNWCSFDFIYGLDDEYYFLEANRPGASYWLELFVGLEVGKEIIMAIKNENLV
jgi:protein associated with RNAse G/E